MRESARSGRGGAARAGRASRRRRGRRAGSAASSRCDDRAELREERRRAALPHLLPARPPHRRIGRDEENGLAVAPLGGEPLEHVSACGRSERRARPRRAPRPTPSKTTTPRAPANGDEAREHVDELVPVGEAARVEEVRAVEEVERRLGQLSTSSRGRAVALAPRLEEHHRRGDAHVERLDAGASGIEIVAVARPPDERPDALAPRRRRRARRRR